MKSFFSRLSDIQAGSSKPTKESSYKFWIPSNINAERSPPKPIPVHPDVVASHGEKRHRASKSTHALKVPLHVTPTVALETQAIHTNDMAKHTTRPNLGSSSTPYYQNNPPPSSRTPRPHEHSDTKYQVPPREAHGPAYPTGTHFRETSSKSHRDGRHESWLPSTTPAVSRQVEDQTKLHVQGTNEKLERYRESGDDRNRVKELERRERDRDRDRREREKEKEREREKGRTREREREERERERSRAKERERGHEKEREIARAKREQDQNREVGRGRDRDKDKHAERDHRERERDSDKEGEKGKNRTKDKGSRKESSNLTRGAERALDSDVPYDGERTKQDEHNKVRRTDRATRGGRKDDNHESHKERDRWLEKEPEKARERLGGQIKYRVEATDSEQDAGRVRTPAPDRERRKDPGIGWASDTHTGHSRKRKTSNTLINPSPGVEDGESSDSSTRPKHVRQVLTKRHRAEEGGSSSKIIHSRQGMPAEPLVSTKSSAVKAMVVTFSEDLQLPVPPTPQHMPIYLPPKESNAIDSGLPPTIAPLNVVSTREAEAPPRKETVSRLKFSRPDEPHAADASRHREIDTSNIRRPPSRGFAQPQNPIPSHPTIAHLLKGTRESGYIHRPRHIQPLMTVNDKLQAPGSSPLPVPHKSTQAEGFKEPNRSVERLPDSRLKREVEVDLVPPVLYKAQHRIPPHSAGAVPSRQPMESTSQTVIPLASADPTPVSNFGSELPREATHLLLQQDSNPQFAAQTDPSHNLQLHQEGLAVMSGNNLAHETHWRMGTPAAQSVSGRLEPMGPPSNTAMQSLQSVPLNENIIQDTGKQAATIVMVSKTNEVEAVTQPQNEVSVSSIKPTERSDHQLYTGLSIHRPSTAMDYRNSLGRGSAVRPYMTSPTFSVSQDTDTSNVISGWRNNVNVISPTLPNQGKSHAATTSNADVHPKFPPLKSSQLRSNGQESLGTVITRPSTTTGFRQNISGKHLRHHSDMPSNSKAFLGEGFQATAISLSHSDAQNSIGMSIPRPSTATTIKQSSSGHSSRQTFNAASQKPNPLVGEEHSSIFPGPSIPRHNSIPVTNPQPTTLPITENSSGFPTQPYSTAPSHTAGPSLTRGHTIVLPEDVTVLNQDVPGSHKQADGVADLNVISHPDNFTSQAPTMLNPKSNNLRNPTTLLAVSIPTSDDDLHSASMSAYRQDNLRASDQVPSIAQNSYQAFKENRVILQPAAPASVNNESAGNNLIPTSLNAKASNPQPIILPSGFTAPQTQIQRSPTSLSTRNNSVPSALPGVVIVPQIQIHHLITTTSTGNKPESPHTDFRAGASTPRTFGAGADLETSDINSLATVNANVVPIHGDQPQTPLGFGNKFHRPVQLVPTSTSHTADTSDVRPSINQGTLLSHAEDSRFKILRLGSSQEVSMQTPVNNHLSTSPPHQPASSVNQMRHSSAQNPILNTQMNNDPPSLGFFNNTFSEVLQSPVVQGSGRGDHPAMKADSKKFHDPSVSAAFETDEDGGTNQVINVKTPESPVNKDTARIALPKEQTEVPSVERLTSRKDLHIDIHNIKAVSSQIPSEVNPSPKGPSSPSQPRIQHPGLAEILSPPPFNKDHNDVNGQPRSSSTTHHQRTTSSTVFSKSGSSPKFRGSPDKQRPDDKLMSPKPSPSRHSPSDLRQKEVEQHSHESPKYQQQQTPTPTSRSAHLQNLLSDPHGGDSLGLTPSKVPSSSHPSIALQTYTTTSSVPDGITHPFLEPMPHVYNKKSGPSGTSHPEVPISTSGPSQVEELASRKIRPPSIVDSKPSSNSIPHYRATTPMRESTSTSTRHQHFASLPVDLVPSANVPSADGPLRSATHPPLHHHPTNHSQIKPGYTRPPGSQTLAPNITRPISDSEETILMTPSSLAHSVMLKPTISRESVTPSMSSQTARKGIGIFTRFRSKTPAQPPPRYEIWHPNTSSDPNVVSSGTVPSSVTFPEQKAPAPIPVPVTSVPIAIERINKKSKVFTPFRYLTTKRNRAISLVSVEAQDGTAPSTVVGSPTASMHSQAPFQPPPVRDPMQATKEWRNKEEAEAHPNGKLRRQRPGVVFDVAEEPPGGDRQRPRRTHTRHKSSSKPS